MAIIKKVGIDEYGIAFSHPVGSKGCRPLVTLMYEMPKRDLNLGPFALEGDGLRYVNRKVVMNKFFGVWRMK